MKNKYLVNARVTLCFLFVVFIFARARSLNALDILTYNYGGLTREYILYVPDNLPSNAPLVFVLHGYGGSAKRAYNSFNMNKVADSAGFAVCYPQGSLDKEGNSHWNARLTISETDDIGFLKELAKYLRHSRGFSSENTFSCGMSNGGFMSYTLACEASDVFNGIASVCGTMSGYSWENCDPEKPVSVLHIHGTGDKVVPIDGSMGDHGGSAGAPSVDKVAEWWAYLNKCDESDSVDIDDNTRAYYYRGGINDNEVWFYKLFGWEHSWPGSKTADLVTDAETNVNASELIWKFFSLIVNRSSYVPRHERDRKTGEVFIYPNPANTFLNIRRSDSVPTEYTLMNILGKVVKKGGSNEKNFAVDISKLPRGVYLINIDNSTYRFIKNN